MVIPRSSNLAAHFVPTSNTTFCSPDVPLSHQIKKPRVATPQPSPRAASLIVLESDDGDQGGSPSPPPKRSYVALFDLGRVSFYLPLLLLGAGLQPSLHICPLRAYLPYPALFLCTSFCRTKGLSGSSKGSSSMATRKQLVPGAKYVVLARFALMF